MRQASCLLAIVLWLGLAGCGKLSKSEAEEQIKKEYFDNDDALLCTWLGAGSVTAGGLGKATVLDTLDDQACVHGLEAERALVVVETDSRLSTTSFRPGPNGRFIRGSFEFKCGTRSFKEITSITTEGSKATVKFIRTAHVDASTMQRVATCKLSDPPVDGDAERTVVFTKDDSGTWRLAK